MKNKWKLFKPNPGDKDFFILGPIIGLSIDYDDVDHDEVMKEAKRVTDLLNEADK